MTNKENVFEVIKNYRDTFYKDVVFAETTENTVSVWDSSYDRKDKFVHTGLIYLLQQLDVSMELINDKQLNNVITLVIKIH